MYSKLGAVMKGFQTSIGIFGVTVCTVLEVYSYTIDRCPREHYYDEGLETCRPCSEICGTGIKDRDDDCAKHSQQCHRQDFLLITPWWIWLVVALLAIFFVFFVISAVANVVLGWKFRKTKDDLRQSVASLASSTARQCSSPPSCPSPGTRVNSTDASSQTSGVACQRDVANRHREDEKKYAESMVRPKADNVGDECTTNVQGESKRTDDERSGTADLLRGVPAQNHERSTYQGNDVTQEEHTVLLDLPKNHKSTADRSESLSENCLSTERSRLLQLEREETLESSTPPFYTATPDVKPSHRGIGAQCGPYD